MLRAPSDLRALGRKQVRHAVDCVVGEFAVAGALALFLPWVEHHQLPGAALALSLGVLLGLGTLGFLAVVSVVVCIEGLLKLIQSGRLGREGWLGLCAMVWHALLGVAVVLFTLPTF